MSASRRRRSNAAGIAGVALSQVDNVSPVVVFGGVGNLWGTLENGAAHRLEQLVADAEAATRLAWSTKKCGPTCPSERRA